MPSIAFSTSTTAFGELLMAAGDRGVTALAFGSNETELLGWLRTEFPQHNLQRDDAGLQQFLAAAYERIDGRDTAALPLTPGGSDFQLRVWDALQRIPYGETRTYTQVAAMVGLPNAVRAVASACANNPISLLVPCHRVVGADGTLRGYRWGLDRKRALLNHEQQIVLSRSRGGMARSA